MQAGRVMLNRLDRLTALRVEVAFESTCQSKFRAHDQAPDSGRLPVSSIVPFSADMAVNRVRERLTVGGHDVPEEVIRRRYAGGLRNFFQIYFMLRWHFSWRSYDNSLHGRHRLGGGIIRPCSLGLGSPRSGTI